MNKASFWKILLRHYFGKRSLLGPGHVILWTAIFFGNASFVADVAICFGALLCILHMCGVGQTLPKQYAVHSRLRDVELSGIEAFYWEIVGIAPDRKKATIRCVVHQGRSRITYSPPITLESHFILHEFVLDNEHSRIAA